MRKVNRNFNLFIMRMKKNIMRDFINYFQGYKNHKCSKKLIKLFSKKKTQKEEKKELKIHHSITPEKHYTFNEVFVENIYNHLYQPI